MYVAHEFFLKQMDMHIRWMMRTLLKCIVIVSTLFDSEGIIIEVLLKVYMFMRINKMPLVGNNGCTNSFISSKLI
jgi:uncharacterized membrane protein